MWINLIAQKSTDIARKTIGMIFDQRFFVGLILESIIALYLKAGSPACIRLVVEIHARKVAIKVIGLGTAVEIPIKESAIRGHNLQDLGRRSEIPYSTTYDLL